MSTAPRLPPPRGAPALSVSDDQAPRPRLAEPTRGQPPKPLKSPLSTSSSPSPSQSPPDAAPPMASPAAPLALLILLVSLAIAAAQSGQPSSPPRNSTNISDAAALHTVFEKWGLEDGTMPQGYHPCGKLVWSNSSEMEASINCSCSSNECRITHLNVTGYRNITFIPAELFSLTELVSLDLSNNNLIGQIPPQVSNLSKLETWHFNNNRLNESFPNASALLSLQSLMIGDLDTEGYPFNFTGDWVNLSTLSLRNCGFTGKFPNQILKNLNKLTYVDLRSNNLSGSIDLQQYNSENNFNGSLPDQMPQSLEAQLADPVSFAVNCGGKQYTPPSDPSTMFNDDSANLGAADFHVDTNNNWVVSHVGTDPFSNSSGIVTTGNGTNMPELYRTARTSTGSLWYYVVGLPSGKYTVQLFFAEIVIESGSGRRLFNIDIQDRNIMTDFDISKEAGGSNRPINRNYTADVTTSVLKIHLYWNGRGTCCIPHNGTYGPLVSAIRVFPSAETQASPPPAAHTSRHDEKRRGVVAGIAALSIAATVISSSAVYLWWKWVSLVKHRKA
uniref:non-specific serine/threonine protein kinase n=1 Tax=Oryza nivara TaxID=4536 RepID=A0A0E0FI13_ORYNI